MPQRIINRVAQTLRQTKQLRARVFQAHLQTCGEHQPGFAKPPPLNSSLIWASEQWISAAAGLGSN